MRILILFLLLNISVVYSQNKCKSSKKKISKVEKYVLAGEIDKSIELLSSIQLTCNESDFLNSVGDIYYSLNDLENAYIFYFKNYNIHGLVNANKMSVVNFLISSYKRGYYSTFNDVISDPNFNSSNYIQINDLISRNNFALESKRKDLEIKTYSLDINSFADEYFPSMPINSDILIYTYRNSSKEFPDEDFYISRKEFNTWTSPIRLGENINSEYSEGALSVSLDGCNVFFASCHRPDSYGGCDIYYSSLINDTLWSPAYNLGDIINTKYWESQPSISADGNLLFFVSNRHGGYGGKDIWMTRKQNNSWSSPINLGPSVNTSSDESTPYLHYDNKTFYFASKGHKGLGGFDLYVAHIDSVGGIHDITNLGYPINSHYDESGLIVSKDGLTAYYNTNKNKNLDIYSFELPLEFQSNRVATINGQVIDSISRFGIETEILISKANHNKSFSIKSSPQGLFSYPLPVASNFTISVLCNGYDFFSSNYTLDPAETNKNIKIVLNRLSIGNKISLDNIYYDFDDYSLKESSLLEIKRFATYLIVNSNLKVEIGGHTDDVGSVRYNNELSKKRAKSVYDALINYGVSSNQLTFKGYGFSDPIFNNDSDEARLQNRRTEVKVIGSYE